MKWNDLFKGNNITDETFSLRVQEFTLANENWEKLLRAKIHSQELRRAVDVLCFLKPEQQNMLFDELLLLACGRVTHREVLICRKLVLNLEFDWTEKQIMGEIKKYLLDDSDNMSYAWSIDLLIGMRKFDCAREIIDLALLEEDRDIQEVGERYNEFISNPESEEVARHIKKLIETYRP